MLWSLNGDDTPPLADTGLTDISNAQAALALVGNNSEDIVETLMSVDIFDSAVLLPCMFQAPVLDVPSQIIRLGNRDGTDTIVFAFARGYGQTMAEEILESDQGRKPVPVGEKVFTDWLAQ